MESLKQWLLPSHRHAKIHACRHRYIELEVEASPVRRCLVGGECLRRLLAIVLRVLDQGWVLRHAVAAAVALLLRDYESRGALQGRALDALAWIWNPLAERKQGSESNEAKHCYSTRNVRARMSGWRTQ